MKWILVGVGVALSGCKKEMAPEAAVDNSATRYAAGLVTATEKAKITADQANQAIAAAQAAMDKMAEEAP